MSSPNNSSNNTSPAQVKVETNGDSIKQRCLELQSKISKVETDTSLLSLAITRSSRTVKRLRTEYLVLLEALEKKSQRLLSSKEQEPPSSPELEPEDINQLLQSSISKLSARLQNSQSNQGKKSALFNSKRGPRKIKDPNFPKRPTNAYLLYCEGEKERVKSLPLEEQEKIPDLSKHLTEGWKSLDDEGRKPYYKIYEQDKERFTRELEEYERKKALEQTTTASEPPQQINASTPDVEEEDVTHPAIKKIKLEEAQFPSSSSPQAAESATATPTPAIVANPETEDDITGMEDDEEEEEEEEGEEEEGEEEDDDEEEEGMNSILPVADAEEAEDEEMDVDENLPHGDDGDDDAEENASTPPPSESTAPTSITVKNETKDAEFE